MNSELKSGAFGGQDSDSDKDDGDVAEDKQGFLVDQLTNVEQR